MGSDIDNSALELHIAEAIARTPHLAALVDEFYFEYHFDVKVEGLNNGWTRDNGMADKTVDDALHLMHRMRRQGIRSHFWV